MSATSYAEIEPLAPEWLWPGRIPSNELTIIAGDGGIGKGFLLADLVSRVTRGAPMPDGSLSELGKGSVIMVTAEDDPSMAMAYRLRAARADLGKVYDMTSDDFRIPDSLPTVAEVIDKLGDVRLVVIDPMSAVASIPITSGNVKVRHKLMNPPWHLARDKGCAVVIVHHTVKSGRTAGNKAITDTARMVLRISRAQDERVRIINVEKTNMMTGDVVPDVAYTIAGSFPDVGVRWLAMPEDGETPGREPTTPERIVALLTDHGEPLETREIARRLEVDYGAVRTALTRLKSAGDVHSPKRGTWTIKGAGELVALPTGTDTDK